MATFYNQATLSYNDTVTNSNIVAGELVEVLSASKTATDDSYQPGDLITYIVSLINSGTVPYTDMTISDDLGTYTLGSLTLTPLTYVTNSLRYFTNGVLQPAPLVTAGPPLNITGITIPAGGNATLIYEARVNEYASPQTTGAITNTVTITGDGLSTTLTATETINSETTAQLSISKSVSPETVSENGQLTYTFVIQNTGNTAAVATDNVAVTDTFNPILSNISVTFDGTAWSSPANYSYNASTGLFQTVPGQITIPAASYTQDPLTGIWSITPGSAILRVTGTV